jgi:biopolymer transport protein ExbD/biopolymer transport protein TolR
MNVTPLVDVVLVLLIIFMVVAPKLDQDVPVNLPGIYNPDPEVESQVDPLKVSFAKTGEYHLNEQQYDLDGVIEALSEAHATEPTRRLVLRGDEKLTYGQVRELFGRAQKVGFPGIALMVGEKHQVGKQSPSTALPDEPPKPDGELAAPAPATEG